MHGCHDIVGWDWLVQNYVSKNHILFYRKTFWYVCFGIYCKLGAQNDSTWCYPKCLKAFFFSFCPSSCFSYSPDQFRGGDPVWTGYPRGPGCGLDSRKHLLGGEQSGPDRSGQTGWDHENHPTGRWGGAPQSHRPRPSRWVRSTDLEILPL